MYIHTKKISETENEVLYEFFNDLSTKNGQFIFYKDKCKTIQPHESILNLAKLIEEIELEGNQQSLYLRAVACVRKEFKVTGVAPEYACFYGG